MVNAAKSMPMEHKETQTSDNELDVEANTATNSESDSEDIFPVDNEECYTKEHLQQLYDSALQRSSEIAVQEWVNICQLQISKDRTQFAEDPSRLRNLLRAKRELLSVKDESKYQQLPGLEFLNGLCRPFMMEQCYYTKPGFDRFTEGKVWEYYTNENGRELREKTDGWVEMRNQNEWIAAWEHPRYYVPGRSFSRKQSDDEASKGFCIVRKDCLLLELFIRGTQATESSSVTNTQVNLLNHDGEPASSTNKMGPELLGQNPVTYAGQDLGVSDDQNVVVDVSVIPVEGANNGSMVLIITFQWSTLEQPYVPNMNWKFFRNLIKAVPTKSLVLNQAVLGMATDAMR